MYLSCSFCSVPKVRTTLLATRASSAQAVLDASTSCTPGGQQSHTSGTHCCSSRTRYCQALAVNQEQADLHSVEASSHFRVLMLRCLLHALCRRAPAPPSGCACCSCHR